MIVNILLVIHYLTTYCMFFAEKAGFEPAIRFRRIHAFQACLLNRSSISPYRKSVNFSLKTCARYEIFITYNNFIQ